MEQEYAQIFVIDDEPDICWAMEEILSSTGYTVTSTTKGTEALELIARNFYSVVFVDAKLADLNGMQLVGLIRQRSSHTAIVLISGYFYPEDPVITEGLQADLFISFIAKPFEVEKIRRLARQGVEWAKERNKTHDLYSIGG
ncbi:MAG: response regulator [Chloroflexi bacterium]|nr:response regulator [Chloroflexota bacterium]